MPFAFIRRPAMPRTIRVLAALILLSARILCASDVAFSQERCSSPPGLAAIGFLREFERARNRESLTETYERYISRDRRFSMEEFNSLKIEVIKRFGARPDGAFREPELVGDRPFNEGNARGAEVTLLVSYPEGRVTQITRLLCESGVWKVFAFEFRPR